MSGTKHDDGKVQIGLLPWVALLEVAKVMTFGARKYAAHNWMQGFDWSRLVDSTHRHLMSFQLGVDKDEESGLLHLAHAGCCILFLLTFQLLGLGKDDRYKFEGELVDSRGAFDFMMPEAGEVVECTALEPPQKLAEGQRWKTRDGHMCILRNITGNGWLEAVYDQGTKAVASSSYSFGPGDYVGGIAFFNPSRNPIDVDLVEYLGESNG